MLMGNFMLGYNILALQNMIKTNNKCAVTEVF